MKICYITLNKETGTRDKVYLDGLVMLGVEIVECRDWSPSVVKFWKLFKKYRTIGRSCDLILIGYSSYILVPFIRLISSKKIIFNAFGSLYDGIIMSRKKYGFLGLRVVYVWLIDWLAYHSADLTLVDTNARKEYIMRKFFVSEHKLARLWIGVDENIFVYNPKIQKLPVFTVLFRGGLLPEAGIEYMIQAARILQHEPINFRIMGFGIDSPLVAKMLREFDSRNVEWISTKLPQKELPAKMQKCHISLGQLSDHKRQNFHSTFKTPESMALKIPYLITRNSFGMLEFLTDNETCFCINPADPEDLAQKILWCKNHPEELSRIAENAYHLFQLRFTSKVLSEELKNIISNCLTSNN